MKKLSVLLVAIAATVTANASYLYWQVQSTDYSHITEPNSVTGVNVWAIDDKGTKTFVDGYRATDGNPVNMTQAQEIDVSTFSTGSYTFYVELMNYSSGPAQRVGETFPNNQTYASMVEAHYISDTPLSITLATPWHGGAIVAPEPTSGLLMLFGLAGLALKRRKA